MRLLCLGHGDVSVVLCLGADRARLASAGALNITQHPTAAWTLQQLREAIGCGDSYRYLVHDRDSIFAEHLDASISRLGLRVLKSPPRRNANAICARDRNDST